MRAALTYTGDDSENDAMLWRARAHLPGRTALAQPCSRSQAPVIAPPQPRPRRGCCKYHWAGYGVAISEGGGGGMGGLGRWLKCTDPTPTPNHHAEVSARTNGQSAKAE